MGPEKEEQAKEQAKKETASAGGDAPKSVEKPKAEKPKEEKPKEEKPKEEKPKEEKPKEEKPKEGKPKAEKPKEEPSEEENADGTKKGQAPLEDMEVDKAPEGGVMVGFDGEYPLPVSSGIPDEEFDEDRLPPGMVLFYETFRRADKNDDGHLSLEEFITYFKDSTVTQEQLEDLFVEIDIDGNHNIEIDELLRYFLAAYEPYQQLFSNLLELQKRVQEALVSTAAAYPTQGALDQFRTRFFLKEAATQMSTLVGPLESAVRMLEATRVRLQGEEDEVEISEIFPKMDKIVPPIATSTFDLKAIELHVNRIEKMLARVEKTVFGSLHLNMIDPEYGQELGDDDSVDSDEEIGQRARAVDFIDEGSHILVLREILVLESEVDVFRKELFRIYVKAGRDLGEFYIYELWDSERSLSAHQTSYTFKTFAKAAIDFYARPETITVMPLPAAWIT